MRRAEKKPPPTPEPANEPELVVDRDLKNPRPLDRNISTVSLKTVTNNVTEGYDLQLSATFGKERVALLSEEFEIEVDFSMNKANIELSFHNCDFAEINEAPRVEEYRRIISEHADKRTSGLAKIASRLSAGPTSVVGKAEAEADIKSSAVNSSTIKQEIVRYDWSRLGPDTITVGGTNNYLQGPMITDFKGWHITPRDSDSISGVVARVKVREAWINFDKPQILKYPPSLFDKVKMLMGDHRRKQYFGLLLRHLIMNTDLSEHQNGIDATIASHVLLVRPNNPQAMSPYAGDSRRRISIDGNQVQQWLTAEEGHEVSALIALGLRAEVIEPSAHDEPSRAKRGSFAIPDSIPRHALATFKDIYARRSIAKTDALFPTSLHDLRALKLIENDGDKLVAIPKPNLDPEILLRRAVSSLECINITRQVLLIKPDANQVDVGTAVALELGKKWPTLGSRQRNGGAILRYAIWLEPHLLDESTSSDTASRLAYALDTKLTRKGRPLSLMRKHEPELRRLAGEGWSDRLIGETFNVSHETIRNWRSKLGISRP